MKIAYNVEAYTPSGEPVYRIRLTNESGAFVEVTNWGARWITSMVPDANGRLANVLAGYDCIEEYLSDSYYMGAIVGRFANRIANARFTIHGETFHLEANDGHHTNHGGFSGFHNKLWEWQEIDGGVRLELTSPDGEGGYPGTIRVKVDYLWSEDNELSIRYYGQTDRPTYLNMTNHAYFNLTGRREKITSHYLTIPSEWILDTNSKFIPNGKKVSVLGTPFDFTHRKQIAKDLYAAHQQLAWNKGYNHCYVLKEASSPDLLTAASLCETESHRRLTVKTDLPGVLLYTAGYYARPDTAVCLETQYFPDTPSHPHFPSCLLNPGEVYDHLTVYRFDNL